MGKKIDLSKKNGNTNFRPNRNPRPLSYSQNQDNINVDEQSLNSNAASIDSKSQLSNISNTNKKNGMFSNLQNSNRLMGETSESYERTSEEKYKVLIKNPAVKKAMLIGIPIALIVFISVIGILALILYMGGSLPGMGISFGGYYEGDICPTITVVNTGCDGNTANNCTHKYDGEVEFEDYVAGVIAAELGSGLELEYYKVQAIASRTFVLAHVGPDCKIDGNASSQVYMDVEDSASSELIKQAVEETKGLVMTKEDKLSGGHFASACVVNKDDENYYVRYGSISLGEAKIQEIPKEFDQNNRYKGYLAYWYSLVDQNNSDYYNKSCPKNHDYGMTAIGALYLIQEKNYNYEQVLNYYYGNNLEIKDINTTNSTKVEGFINPVNNGSCSSGFGCRLHPIHNQYRSHSGIDLAATSGTPVYASKDGTIIDVLKTVPGYSETYGCGNLIYIDHKDGTKTRYCHLLYGSIPDNIKIGATVNQGEVIGLVGSTGTSTGPHLHYEVYINGALKNPIDYLDLSKIGNQNACNSNSSVPLNKCGL